MRYLMPAALLLLLCGCDSQTEEIPLDTWQDVTPDTAALFQDAFFVSAERGWVLGESRCRDDESCTGWGTRIYSTRDGGDSWERATVPGSAGSLRALHFFSARHGIAAAYSVWESTDGGRSWSKAFEADQGRLYRDMDFSSASVGWSAGLRGGAEGPAVMRSTDGGQTWQELEGSYRPSGTYLGVSAPSSRVVYAVGFALPPGVQSYGVAVRTLDGGETWEDVSPSSEAPARFSDVDFVDEEWGWVVGGFRTIYRTTDGGETWEEQDAGGGADAIYGFDAIDRSHAIAVTSAGAVLVTRDGGGTWEEQVAASESPLGHAFYHESGAAYATGNGVVLRARLSR